MKPSLRTLVFASAAASVFAGCQKLWDQIQPPSTPDTKKVVLKDYSVTPALVRMFPAYNSVGINTLISSDDVLEKSKGFIFGAQPDGAGLLRNPDGKGFVLINNHEILR
jgi:hypothetical protein